MRLSILSTALLLAACGAAPDESRTETAAVTPGAEEAPAPAQMGPEDALVEGTDYNATASIPCGFDGAAPTGSCKAGVKRKWGEDGTTLVEVEKPDGFTRAIFVKGTEPFGADSAEADGSAGWDFATSREGDRVTVSFGPETYVLVDAFLEGG